MADCEIAILAVHKDTIHHWWAEEILIEKESRGEAILYSPLVSVLWALVELV